VGEGPGEERQRAERPRDTHAFPRGALVEPDAPAQPVGARSKSVVPACARIELTDEIQQAGSGGVEVSGQLGDLFAQPLERDVVFRNGNDLHRFNVHHVSLALSDCSP
jgi:hypothetical protein